MGRYLIRRLMISIVTLIAISMIVYSILYLPQATRSVD
jgi:ABC-type dipeptide/oligopeptide/nickel transport system permease component